MKNKKNENINKQPEELSTQPLVQQKSKKLRLAINTFLILFIIAMLGTAGWLLWQEHFPNNEPLLKHQVSDTTDEGTTTIDWNALTAINADIVGWLTIENTNIDTPIVQTSNNSTYLSTSFYGVHSTYGTPFLDYEYQWDPQSINSVIYGHSNMRDGTTVMFDILKEYRNIDYYSSHQYIDYNRPDDKGGDQRFQIFAVLVEEANYDYRQIDFASDPDFINYYTRIEDASVIDTGVGVAPGDEILTLSTCIFNVGLNDGRLAIIAKKVTS